MLLQGSRLLNVVLTVTVGAALVGATSPSASTARAASADVALLAGGNTLIMGGSSMPIPPPSYMAAVSQYFPAEFADFNHIPLFTPEGASPVYTGVKSLQLDPSVAQGVQILHHAITKDPADGGYAGNDLLVLGYSQSAAIASLEMRQLAAMGENAPDADSLSFVLLGNLMTPNGGLMERFGDVDFPPLTLPSLGLTFYGATPVDTIYSTNNYSIQYDGFADFPRYPLNFLSTLNAFMGIALVHGSYPRTDLADSGAFLLPGSADLTGEGATNYWMIPTETLPLLQPFAGIPGIGEPLVDLLDPVLRVLVNWGYGDLAHGTVDTTTFANVATPFGLWPTDISATELVDALGGALAEGWQAFTDHLSSPADLFAFGAADEGTDTMAEFTLPSLTDVVNTVTSATATAYSTLLPTADIFNFLSTTLPLYQFNLFSHFLEEGDLLSAIGMPAAAAVGLSTMALGFEFMVLQGAVKDIAADFSGLFD